MPTDPDYYLACAVICLLFWIAILLYAVPAGKVRKWLRDDFDLHPSIPYIGSLLWPVTIVLFVGLVVIGGAVMSPLWLWLEDEAG